MSCDDPRRRPVDEREKADRAHDAFRVPKSDFLGSLKLWNWWENENKNLSQSKLRQLAKKNYLSYPKMREWRELTRQLTELSKRLKLDVTSDNGGECAFHRAIASGLLSRIGHLDPETNEYRGAHAIRFSLHPSGVLAKRGKREACPEWIVAGELVDTSKLFARNVAVIDPGWIEDIAGNLCKRSYRDPSWDAQHGFVRAIEQVTLYGLVIIPSRRRDYSRIDPVVSRELFILHALVMGEFPAPVPALVKDNLKLIKELGDRAERLRRPELFDAGRISKHFDKVIPKEIVCAGDLRKYLAVASTEEKKRFTLDKREWLSGIGVSQSSFPDFLKIGSVTLSLSYRHTPDDPEKDGITCTVKKSDATILRLWRHDWLVPGALAEKVMCLLGALPASLRRILHPLNETLAVVMPMLKPNDESLNDALARTIYERFALRIPKNAWDNMKLPPHLKVRFRIRDDESGKIISVSRDLEAALREAGISKPGNAAFSSTKTDNEKHVDWDFGSIEESVTTRNAGWEHTFYPSLHDEGDGVTIQLFRDKIVAAQMHESGITRLMYLQLTKNQKNAKQDDILWASIREAAVKGRPVIRNANDFTGRLSLCRRAIADAKLQFAAKIKKIEKEVREILWDAESLPGDIYDDIETQIAWLTPNGFVKSIPLERLNRYDAYFKALRLRIARAKVSAGSDRNKLAKFYPHWELYTDAVMSKKTRITNRIALSEYRWMLEEYRISLFAQEVKTSSPISPQRLEAKWLEATDETPLV